MALEKSKDSGKGYSAKYWRIDNFRHINGGRTEVFIAGYVDKETRDSNIQGYVDSHAQSVNIDKEVLEKGNVLAEIYSKIKEPKPDEQGMETNFFADAESV